LFTMDLEMVNAFAVCDKKQACNLFIN
jgi:hypothetical protein